MISMFLMVAKDINGRICHTFHGYGKAGHKYIKMIKIIIMIKKKIFPSCLLERK